MKKKSAGITKAKVPKQKRKRTVQEWEPEDFARILRGRVKGMHGTVTAMIRNAVAEYLTKLGV